MLYTVSALGRGIYGHLLGKDLKTVVCPQQVFVIQCLLYKGRLYERLSKTSSDRCLSPTGVYNTVSAL